MSSENNKLLTNTDRFKLNKMLLEAFVQLEARLAGWEQNKMNYTFQY